MPKLDLLCAANLEIMDRGGGGGDVNDPPPWDNLLQLNSLVVRGLIELKM